jgi:hypothetical protein
LKENNRVLRYNQKVLPLLVNDFSFSFPLPPPCYFRDRMGL